MPLRAKFNGKIAGALQCPAIFAKLSEGAPFMPGKIALRVALCTVPLFAPNPAGKNLFKQKNDGLQRIFPCKPSIKLSPAVFAFGAVPIAHLLALNFSIPV